MITAQQGTTYTVTGKVNVEASQGAKVQLYVDYIGPNGEPLGANPGKMEQSTISNGFVELQNVSTAPKNTAYLKVWALLRSTADNASGTFYVDDLNITASSDNPPAQPIVDLIPKMTSNTTPLGKVLVSANSTSLSPYTAFDSNSTTDTVTSYSHGAPTGYIGYDFETRAVVRQYAIRGSLLVNMSPRSWTFEGFDGTNWVELDKQSNIGWLKDEMKTFNISNTRVYWQYRLNVTENNGDPNTFYLQELFMNGYYPEPIPPQNVLNSKSGNGTVTLKWLPSNGVTSYEVFQDGELVKTLPASTTTATFIGLTNDQVYHYTVRAVNGAGKSLHSAEVLAMPFTNAQWLNPYMTSNTTPYGLVTASSNNATAYQVFDHSSGSAWGGSETVGTLEYDFGTPTLVKEYTINMGVGSTIRKNPKKWTFEGFNGNEWVILDAQVTNLGDPMFFTMDNKRAFTKYRLNVTENMGDPTGLSISELQLLGDYLKPVPPTELTNPTTGPGYVNLEWSGVTGATTYAIYQNGTKIKTVTANTGAAKQSTQISGLTDGTQYVYTVTAIIATGLESDVSEAVVAEPYSGLQWKNPTMTSNTAPTGTVWASQNPDNAYRLFDHGSGNWVTSPTPSEVIYEFQDPVAINQYTINPTLNSASPKDWTFEAFNGTDWVLLDTKTDVTNWVDGKAKYYPIGNYNLYQKYRFKFNANNGDPTYLMINEIQLIGQ
jgi:hypothetical protein